jgi:hypothetical protein
MGFATYLFKVINGDGFNNYETPFKAYSNVIFCRKPDAS